MNRWRLGIKDCSPPNTLEEKLCLRGKNVGPCDEVEMQMMSSEHTVLHITLCRYEKQRGHLSRQGLAQPWYQVLVLASLLFVP